MRCAIRSGSYRASLALVCAAFLGCSAAAEEQGDGSRALAAGSVAATTAGEAPLATVYKSPTCGCCAKWVDHLRRHGFRVEVHDTTDLEPIKARHGVPSALQSCHTAIVGDYVIEGHVPADVIQRLLRERPAVAGMAVPGMPMGSPGMEGPYREEYDVVAFTRDGSTHVYAKR